MIPPTLPSRSWARFVSGFKEVAVMAEAVEERRSHLGIAEHTSPFAEAEAGMIALAHAKNKPKH